MSLIQWRDEFSVGVPSVDHEHREMIELINQVHQDLVAKDTDEARVIDFLGEIYARISAHFALEEHIMREREYHHYEEHKADHDRLLDDIRDIMDDYEDHRNFNQGDLSGRLENWFVAHFKDQDARLHKHLD